MDLKRGDTVVVTRDKAFSEARVVAVHDTRFTWRAVGFEGKRGGIGRSKLRDEGVTWVRECTEDKIVAAFVVAVSL